MQPNSAGRTSPDHLADGERDVQVLVRIVESLAIARLRTLGRCIGRWEVENDKKNGIILIRSQVRMREKRCAGTMEV